MLSFLAPRTTVHAHCDLPCGVYDPAQARLEAESVKACMVKYAASDDTDFRARAVSIKEERSDLVKHHLWVLWTDYFKAPHFEKYPQLNSLFNEATKLAGAGGTKGTNDVAVADSAARQDRRDRRDLLGDQGGVTSPEDPRGGAGPRCGHRRPRSGLRAGTPHERRPPGQTSGLPAPRTSRRSWRWCASSPSTSAAPHEVQATEEMLGDLLFGSNTPSGAPAAYCHVAPRRRRRRAPTAPALAGHGPVVPQRLDLAGPARDLPRGPLCPPGLPRASASARP